MFMLLCIFTELYSTKAYHSLTTEQSDYVLDDILPFVCHIKLPHCGGTGFVVGGLTDAATGRKMFYMLTCFHLNIHEVMRDKKKCQAVFLNRNSNVPPIIVNILRPVLFCDSNLDYAMFKLEYSQDLTSLFKCKSSIGKIATHNLPAHNDALIICHHPEQERKHIDWGARCIEIEHPDTLQRHGNLRDINAKRYNTPDKVLYPVTKECIYYHCSSFFGSSGSPVISALHQRLYAIHCGSVYWNHDTSKLEFGVKVKSVVENIASQIQERNSQPGASASISPLSLAELYQMFHNQETDMETDT